MKTKNGLPVVRDDYLDLVRRFPLRPIRSAAEYDHAAEVANRLAIRGEEDLSAGERDYLDVLSDLIIKYDEKHFAMPFDKSTPVERLAQLVMDAGMSASDLGRMLGNRTLGAALISGKRELSKNHLRILAAHFRVDAGYFL